MPWAGKTTISNAKNRVKQFDQDRQFDSIKSGRVIPQIGDMKLGEAKEFGLAVMHVDMNNFKKLSGNLSNEKKLRLLNIYFSELTHVIRDYDGFIEKYVGDGITALFGVEKNHEQAVTDAIACGMTILTEIRYTINEYLQSIDLPMFSCSIGIDYGNIWVARAGVQGMNQLTLVGNEVSIAKQLEEFAGNNKILLGGNVYAGLDQEDQNFCRKQSDRADFVWFTNGQRYPFYRYNAFWTGYEL